MTAIFQVYLSEEARKAGISFHPPREQDAGFDIASLEDVTIHPGAQALLRTGLHMAVPLGYVGLIRDRSSVALRGGAVTAGVIDSAYRGEVKIVMHNLGKEPLLFKRGERIAQCLVVPHLDGASSAEVSSLEELGQTDRGAGGFGSTGR
jgi:dUTP pyrophosphatase